MAGTYLLEMIILFLNKFKTASKTKREHDKKSLPPFVHAMRH